MKSHDVSKDPHSSVDTLTELRTSRLLEDRRRLRKALRRMLDAVQPIPKTTLPAEHIRPVILAQIKGLHAIDRSDAIDHSPHKGKGTGEFTEAEREQALEQIHALQKMEESHGV